MNINSDQAWEYKSVARMVVVFLAVGLLVSHTSVAFGKDGVAKGYVSFYTKGQGIGLVIKSIVDGKELETRTNSGGFFSKGNIADYRIETTPGDHEYSVTDGSKYKTRFHVTVKEDSVTYISFRRQFISASVSTTGALGIGGYIETRTDSRFYTYCTLGGTALPASLTPDPAPYIAALNDYDWGTRLEALSALERLSPPIDAPTIAMLKTMAREDLMKAIRVEAGKLLASRNEPLLSKPLYLETFEYNDNNRWYADPKDPVMGFEEDGYFIQPDKDGFWWSIVDIPEYGNFDASLDCLWKKGKTGWPFGLILGKSKSDFFSFGISHDGGAIVSRWTTGATVIAIPVAWNQNAADTIHKHSVSRLTVSKRGKNYTLAVNGVQIDTFSDPDNLPVHSIGVFTAYQQAVVFIRIIVNTPDSGRIGREIGE